MAGLSDFAENKLLNCLLKQTNWTAPTNIYLSLHTADPGDTGANEHPSSGAYARTDVTSAFPTASGSTGQVSNTSQINFPTATADWTTVTHFALWDASTSGNCLLSGALTASRTVLNGSQFQIPVSDLVITAS